MRTIFITGTGTGVGKTLAAAIVTEALNADYWKPVQAGYDDGTDSITVQQLLSNKKSVIHPELYRLRLPASPHISANLEGKKIQIKTIIKYLPSTQNQLIIEGAGGLMVPLNEIQFVCDLIKKMKATVIIVSKNELGSINHSLLTAAVLKQRKIKIAGWIFNEKFMDYEAQIAAWSGYPVIGSIPHQENITKEIVKALANEMRPALEKFL